MLRRALGFLVAALIFSCAHSDQVSAADHRAMAQNDEWRAEQKEVNAEQVSRLVPEPASILYQGVLQAPFSGTPEPPQQSLRRDAATDRAHALEHEQAAAALESFEDQACRGVDPAARSACPLLAPYLSKIVETGTGVQLFFNAGAPMTQIAHRMLCHLAFARARGYKEITACPLYAPGVEMLVHDDDRSVSLSAKSAKLAADLRQRTRTEFVSQLARSDPR